jgi:hypothetical protein
LPGVCLGIRKAIAVLFLAAQTAKAEPTDERQNR